MGKKNSTIDDQIVDFLKEKGFITCTSDFAKYRISQDGNQVDVAYHIGTEKEIFHLGANNGKVEHYYDNDNVLIENITYKKEALSQELLLDRNSQFVVKGFDPENNIIEVDLIQ